MATHKKLKCPKCGAEIKTYRNPLPTVDIIIEMPHSNGGVALIFRKNEPKGWALPGGFVDYGESLEQAAIREAKEETGLTIADVRQFRAYSDPKRDKRGHTISVVFIAKPVEGLLKAGDDAGDAKVFSCDNLPADIAFDHRRILEDYFSWIAKAV
jgi:8-oxo-dGTP diphosphatase